MARRPDRYEQESREVRLIVGEQYLLPNGQKATYYGRASRQYVLVDGRGRHQKRAPHVFGKLGGLLLCGLTDKDAARAILVKKRR
jgi:hypothetical protein